MVLALPGIELYATRFAQQVLSQLSYTPIREFASFKELRSVPRPADP